MREIIDLLQQQEWYNGNEFIEIAKGKYSIPKTIGQRGEKIKRFLIKRLWQV